MREFWLIKIRAVLGLEPGDDQEVSILNLIARWPEGCLLYEGNPRHVEQLLRNMIMDDCKRPTVTGIEAASDATALQLLSLVPPTSL